MKKKPIIIGPVFRYSGAFKAEMIDMGDAGIPDEVKPLREESRE